MTKVVKIKDAVPGAVRVDRQSRWGNPFVLGVDGDRDQVCDLFRKYAEWRLGVQPNWLDDLRDKDVACHCYPKRCHGESLIDLANKEN